MFVELWTNIFNANILIWIFILSISLLIYKLVWKEKLNGRTKHALVTGCDSGFGYLTAYELNALEVNVFAGCLTNDGVQALQDDPVFKGVAFKLDITNLEDIESAYTIIKNHVGSAGLWCVINNAGVAGFGPIEWVPVDDMKKCMDVNVWGGVNVTKTMLPLIKKAKGRVVNITSFAGRCVLINNATYCMTKYAFEAFSDGLRYEMKHWGVSVHIIEPGLFRTPIVTTDYSLVWKKLWEKQSARIKEEYGEEYFRQMASFTQKVLPLASSDVKKVPNAVCHAALSSNPKIRYVVGYDANTVFMFIVTLPTYIADYLIDFINVQIETPVPANPK